MKHAIFVGKNDSLATTECMSYLKERLGQHLVSYVELDDWDHSSFVMGRNMKELGSEII